MMNRCGVFERLELRFQSEKTYRFPFAEVRVLADFSGPDGRRLTLRAHYDGDESWVVRFVPDAAGRWSYRLRPFPADGGLCASGEIVVEAGSKAREKGFLRAHPGDGWGLRFDGGEDLLVIGDTMYNLFGAAYCGVDIRKILVRRKAQGHNLIRVKLNPTPFQQGFKYAPWFNRPVFPWAGSPEMPDYTAFNLDYFRAVDGVFELLEELDMGVELIVMPFGYELPMTDRWHFLPEHQELYVDYIVSRYSAYQSLYLWDVSNEYNLYALARIEFNNGPLEEVVCARYAERIAGLIREADGYRHPIGAHDTASGSDVVKPLKERFAPWSGIDVLLFQSWGDMDSQRSRDLCSGLEDAICCHAASGERVYILAEYGYEADPEECGPAEKFGPAHTRRGAWRALMSGAHVMCGYDNTSVTVVEEENDFPGIRCILPLHDFFNTVVNFAAYRPADQLLRKLEDKKPKGERALCLATPDASSVIVYLPTGGKVGVRYQGAQLPEAYWFDPMTGALSKAEAEKREEDFLIFSAPGGKDEGGNGKDWALLAGAPETGKARKG